MARRTLSQEIAILEARRDELEQILMDQQRYDEVQAGVLQGVATKTKFADLEALGRELERVKSRLEILYLTV